MVPSSSLGGRCASASQQTQQSAGALGLILVRAHLPALPAAPQVTVRLPANALLAVNQLGGFHSVWVAPGALLRRGSIGARHRRAQGVADARLESLKLACPRAALDRPLRPWIGCLPLLFAASVSTRQQEQHIAPA